MLPSRTLFVIGAGAGFEIDMPVGLKLAADIAKRLELNAGGFGERRRGDEQIWRAIMDRAQQLANAGQPGDQNSFRQAAMQIHEGIQTADSIDDFIDRAKNRPDGDKIELCGKLGIVRSILNYEGKVILV